MNSDGELIFVGSNYDIMKLLVDEKLLFYVIYMIYNIWDLICVYWFLVIEDFLVGMYLKLNDVVKVIWYNKIGKLIYII